MKQKRVAMLLIVAVVCIAVAITLCACAVPNTKDYNYSFSVVADIHVMSEEEIVDRQSEDFITYDLVNQKLLIVSEALFCTFIDNFISSDQNALLIAGDLTEQGSYFAHQSVARELKRAEDSGKKVFVINGNHDITTKSYNFKSEGKEVSRAFSKDDFKSVYNDFGYSEALATDIDSLSYTADIGGDYRLIAVDPIRFDDVTNSTDLVLTERLKTWIIEQVETSLSDKKEPIFLCHYPIVPHTGGVMDELSNDLSKTTLASEMRDKGLKFAFTGHVHSTDIAKLTDEDGKSIYDVETGSLISYPSPYRVVFNKGSEVEIKSGTINQIKQEYLLSTLYPSERTEILTDYQAYARKQSMQDLVDYIKQKIAKLKPVLIENGIEENLANEAVDFILETFQSVLDLPLYDKADGISVEKICENYDIDLPELDLTQENPTVFNLIQKFLFPLFAGNENVTEDEITVLKYSVYSVFYIIANSDLYDILSAFDAKIREVDLNTYMVDILFETGKLEVVPLVYSVLNTDIVKALIDDLAEDAGSFGSVITSFYNNAVSKNMEELKTTLYETINTLAWGYITNFRPFGIQVSSYIDVRNVSIDLGKLFDEKLSEIAGGFFMDKAPDDLHIIVNKETTFLVVYE